MKTKIVYCLTSDNKDFYYEQLMISLYSLRKHNPDVSVAVVCDELTNELILKHRKSFAEFNAETIQVDIPLTWDKKVKSRYIKTHLRNIVSGDYLFIDVDTIICAPLDCVDSYDCIIGAVYESHEPKPISKIHKCASEEWIWREAKKAGMNIEGHTHFNSGVFYVKDNPLAYKLYERWAAIHDECKKQEVVLDQLPLLLANKETGDIITPIDHSMNCQVVKAKSLEILPNAKIIHYWAQIKRHIISSPWILSPIKEFDKIPHTIKWVIDNPQKFFCKNSNIIFSTPSV